jgi:hypothetical protein
LRLGPDDVFIDVGDALSRKVVSLDDIVEYVARDSVVEIRQVNHGAAGTGMVFGALGGFVAGVVATVVQCGTNWGQETDSCGNLAPAGMVVFPVWGLAIGGLAGAGGSDPTLVYIAPPPAPPAEG